MKKIAPNIIVNPIATYGVIALFLFTLSCSETAKKDNQQEIKSSKNKSTIIKKPGSSFNDTIIINTESAVFYYPDSLQMEKIEAVNEKNIFDMITHDCHYQIQNAHTVLKKNWPRIKIIDASKARYLLFIKADKSKSCIDLNDKNDICGLFLFDKNKSPVLIDMPNVDTELGFYFKK